MKKLFTNSYLAFILLIIYVPIIVLIIFSFNSGDTIINFQHWSWNAYAELFHQTPLWQSVSVTLMVAFISTIVAVVLGTFAALGLSKTKKVTRNITLGLTNIPLVNADIVTAVSLMLLFLAFGFNFGIVTLILAHISFNIPYVIITVLPRIKAIDNAQLEASQDLGATPWYTLRKVVLPAIKPAIIAGAAIAFAMSFDDFIISYFTGGAAANVSTYIYSLKRVQPYINAFSTIIIILVALVVISWNGFNIAKKQIKIRNERIINQTYRDKKIIKLEKSLNRYYMQLNNVKNIKHRKLKNQTADTFQPVSIIDENKIVSIFQTKIKKKSFQTLIKNINKVETKLAKEQIWVQEIAEKILEKKEAKEEKSRARREKYRFLSWPWKLITIIIATLSLFTGATAFYIISNNYDISLAIWGNYITPELIKKFENQYQVKVKVTNFADNESLYSKLNTTEYDLMVPSDYMVKKLANENRLLPLRDVSIMPDSFNLFPDLKTAMQEYIVNNDSPAVKTNLLDYAVPYFWGNFVLVFNTNNNSNLLTELGIDNIANANWDVLKTAVSKNKQVLINDDMRNIFMLGATTLHYQNKWKQNFDADHHDTGFKDYVNVQDAEQINDIADWLKPLFTSPNTRFENDEIADHVAQKTGWDVAALYNGDLISAINQNQITEKNQFATPYVGTNYWNDDLVISKKTRNKNLAAKFIRFIMEKESQVALSDFGYTSPLSDAMDDIKKNKSLAWQNVYTPGSNQIAAPDGRKLNYNGLYTNNFDSVMQTAYNKLQAHQGNNSALSLIIELLVVLIIIIIFIAGIIAIK